MKYVLFALLFMAVGGLIVHVGWLHSWRMYNKGKAEGQGMPQRARQAERMAR